MIIVGCGSACFFLAALILFPRFRALVIMLAFPFVFWAIAGPVGCVLLILAFSIWFAVSQAYGIPFFGETPEEGEKRRKRRISKYGCGSRNTPVFSEDYRRSSPHWKATDPVSNVDMNDETNPVRP